VLLIPKLKPATFLTKLADERNANSWSNKLRQRRFLLFKTFLLQHYSQSDSLIKIIDIGGRPSIWERNLIELQQVFPKTRFEITVANIQQYSSDFDNIQCVLANATSMKQFRDDEFDVAFSNSVIEHVGEYKAQEKMSKEVLRIGKKFFIQTPNYYFPIEPHFLFPCFQFLPLEIKVWLISNFDLGWRKKTSNRENALMLINSVKLLTRKQLMALFPEGKIFEERILALTKSFIVYGESP
jgi:hypothetical protein